MPLLAFLVSYGFAVTDSVVIERSSVFDVSVNETLALSCFYENELDGHPHYSFLFSGGPLLCSGDYFESTSWGCGVNAELRRYKLEGSSGFFISGAGGAVLKWSDGKMLESIFTGFKFGWKCSLAETGAGLNLEPGFGAGVMLENTGDEYQQGVEPEPYVNFGLSLMIR